VCVCKSVLDGGDDEPIEVMTTDCDSIESRKPKYKIVWHVSVCEMDKIKNN